MQPPWHRHHQTLCRVAVLQSIVPQSSGYFLLLTQIQRAVGHLRLEQTEDVGIVNRGEPFDSLRLEDRSALGFLNLMFVAIAVFCKSELWILTRRGLNIYNAMATKKRLCLENTSHRLAHTSESAREKLDLHRFLLKETRVVGHHAETLSLRCLNIHGAAYSCIHYLSLRFFEGLPQQFLSIPNTCLDIGFQKHLANAASCIGKGLFATSHFTWVETVDMISESKGCEEVQNPGKI